MNRTIQYYTRENGKLIITSVLVWCIAKQLFMAIKLWGIESTDFQSIQVNPLELF